MSTSASSNRRRPKSGQATSRSTSGGPSSSQPFLDLLNPMRSTYHGYTQANQSVIEQEEDNTAATEEIDLEAGPSTFHSAYAVTRLSPKAQGKRRVAWGEEASELVTLHPNIQKEDKMHEQESSDDEVPPSFKVEAAPHHRQSPTFAEEIGRQDPGRGQALYSTSGRNLPPKLPTVTDEPPASVFTPSDDQRSSAPDFPLPRQPRGAMRGLDEYEKALWNWVNVYNLDAYLQEVYYYYEGKGIYSIALARGLKLLYVTPHLRLSFPSNLEFRTVGFVIGFSTFLLGCINYTSLRHEKHSKLTDIIIPQCVSR